MSETIFEHIQNVPSKQIRRLSQRQIERLLTPRESELTVSGLLWSLDLAAYALPDGDLVIGFAADKRMHSHDRWLFYTASPTSPWVTVETEPRQSFRGISQFGALVDKVRASAAADNPDIDFILLKGLAGAVEQHKRVFHEQYGVEVTSRDILLASRLPGALNPTYLRIDNELSFFDAHDMLFHPEKFYERFAQYKGLPLHYVRHLYGMDAQDMPLMSSV